MFNLQTEESQIPNQIISIIKTILLKKLSIFIRL